MATPLSLCREPILLSGEVTLGIHSNVAGDEYGYKDGHAWISVSTRTSVLFLGLWPDGHPRVMEKSENCTDVRIGMENGAQPEVSRYYHLEPHQTAKLTQVINKPQIWRMIYNCSDWSVEVLREVIGVNWDAIDYAIFSTPRELGRILKMIEKHYPTSPDRPHRGPPVEWMERPAHQLGEVYR